MKKGDVAFWTMETMTALTFAALSLFYGYTNREPAMIIYGAAFAFGAGVSAFIVVYGVLSDE